MKAFFKKVLALGLGSMFLLSPIQAAEVEVLHWWTSGGEAAALNVLKEDLQSKGIGWKDMPVAGGGGTQAMTVLRSRVTSGTAPTAVQMLGFDILDWAAEGVLADLNSIAEAGNWGAVIPTALQKSRPTFNHKTISDHCARYPNQMRNQAQGSDTVA